MEISHYTLPYPYPLPPENITFLQLLLRVVMIGKQIDIASISFSSTGDPEEQNQIEIEAHEKNYSLVEGKDAIHMCVNATIPAPSVPSRVIAVLIMLHPRVSVRLHRASA